jgi:hypothetical protein
MVSWSALVVVACSSTKSGGCSAAVEERGGMNPWRTRERAPDEEGAARGELIR